MRFLEMISKPLKCSTAGGERMKSTVACGDNVAAVVRAREDVEACDNT